MPVIILLDVSLSMSRPVVPPATPQGAQVGQGAQDAGRQTRASLAVVGINALLDHLQANSRTECVALIAFSSLYDVVVGFTRDYDLVRQKLRQEEFDRTCIESALVGAFHLALTEWNQQTHTQIVIFTDGCAGEPAPGPAPQAPFPCTLHIVCLASPSEPSLVPSTPVYKRLIESVNGPQGAPQGVLYIPDQPLTNTAVHSMVRRLCNEQLSPWKGILRCGSLEARVTLTPSPLPYTHITDFESNRLVMTTSLDICGFIAMQDIGSAMALSRHLILPPSNTPKRDAPTSPEAPNSPDEDSTDASKVANLCVLLHGALKVENLAGLVQLGDDWYGLVHSWADSKKKSNLMLSVLPPGDDAVPWLGPMSQLGFSDQMEMSETFPVRITERKSYSSAGGGSGSGSAWVHPAGLQTDLQKLLRHARKLPEKMHHFNKEVNRVRRAALALGWVEALKAAADILEREATVLPSSATVPLTLAIHHLRNTTDPKLQLPLS